MRTYNSYRELPPMHWEGGLNEESSSIEGIEREIAEFEKKGQMGGCPGECYERAASFYKGSGDFPKAFLYYVKAAKNYLLDSPLFPWRGIREAEEIFLHSGKKGFLKRRKRG